MKKLLFVIAVTILCACSKQGNEYSYTEIYMDGTEAPTEIIRAESDSMAITIAIDKHIEEHFKISVHNNIKNREKRALSEKFRLISNEGEYWSS